jgi:hypothetical protein
MSDLIMFVYFLTVWSSLRSESGGKVFLVHMELQSECPNCHNLIAAMMNVLEKNKIVLTASHV